jgi:hypothetical protein
LISALVAIVLLLLISDKGRQKIFMTFGLQPRDYLASSTKPWRDDILVDQSFVGDQNTYKSSYKWTSKERWNAPAEWSVAAGPGSDPHDGTLLIQGPSLGTLNIGSSAFYDFTLRFGFFFARGNSAEWMVRSDKSGRNGYLFELAETPTGMELRGFVVRDGQRQPFAQDSFPVACCSPVDPIRVEAGVIGDQFTIRVTISGEPRVSVFRDSTYRFGQIGFLSSGDSIMQLDYVEVVPPSGIVQ